MHWGTCMNIISGQVNVKHKHQHLGDVFWKYSLNRWRVPIIQPGQGKEVRDLNSNNRGVFEQEKMRVSETIKFKKVQCRNIWSPIYHVFGQFFQEKNVCWLVGALLGKKNWPEPTRWIRQSSGGVFWWESLLDFTGFSASMMSVVTQWLIFEKTGQTLDISDFKYSCTAPF